MQNAMKFDIISTKTCIANIRLVSRGKTTEYTHEYIHKHSVCAWCWFNLVFFSLIEKIFNKNKNQQLSSF